MRKAEEKAAVVHWLCWPSTSVFPGKSWPPGFSFQKPPTLTLGITVLREAEPAQPEVGKDASSRYRD